MDRLGLGYEALRVVNPRLVHCCAITGYGADGLRALRGGHDINYLALNGVFSYSGHQGGPTQPGVQSADLGGGLYAVFAIATAPAGGWGGRAAHQSGHGRRRPDLALSPLGQMSGRRPSARPGRRFSQPRLCLLAISTATKEDHAMSLGALDPQFWKLFCQTVGRPDWNTLRYFEPGPHQQDLQREVAALFLTRDLREWTEMFAGADCCCEPVRNLWTRSRPTSRPGSGKWWRIWSVKPGEPIGNRALPPSCRARRAPFAGMLRSWENMPPGEAGVDGNRCRRAGSTAARQGDLNQGRAATQAGRSAVCPRGAGREAGPGHIPTENMASRSWRE